MTAHAWVYIPRARTGVSVDRRSNNGTITRLPFFRDNQWGETSFSRRPTVRGPMLKKDNRPLIYDLDSLVRSPSTFFLSPSCFSLPVFRSAIVSFFFLALSGDHLARIWGIRTRERHRKSSVPYTRSCSGEYRLFGHEVRPSNFSRRIFRPTHKFPDSVIAPSRARLELYSLPGAPMKLITRRTIFATGSSKHAAYRYVLYSNKLIDMIKELQLL